jgi:hypothetical protein
MPLLCIPPGFFFSEPFFIVVLPCQRSCVEFSPSIFETLLKKKESDDALSSFYKFYKF